MLEVFGITTGADLDSWGACTGRNGRRGRRGSSFGGVPELDKDQCYYYRHCYYDASGNRPEECPPSPHRSSEPTAPGSRQRSILSTRWHWPTLTAFGPFWTVARHRMAIVPGDQFALWASSDPGGFRALGSVTAGAGEVPDKDLCWPDPAEGERLTSHGPLRCRYLVRRSCRLSILCDYHHPARVSAASPR